MQIFLKDIENFIEILKNKAKEHKYTVMMGTDTRCSC